MSLEKAPVARQSEPSQRSSRSEVGSVSRREFCLLAGSALAAAAGARSLATARDQPAEMIVGAHPWVYAATEPNYDITPILDRIFADMAYAAIEGIELMHTALGPEDAVERIAALAAQYRLPVIGTSFGGDMWDKGRHAEILADAELVISRLARLGGRTLGTSVGAYRQREDA